jgi:Ca2+-binding RTX toxin-like protein
VIVGTGDDTITNSKLIDGSVGLGDGDDKLTNSGTITGDVYGLDGNDVIKNTGTVTGVINLGDGDDSFSGGGKTDTLTDSNDSDTVKLAAGNDTYIATGAAAGNDGNDIIDGGAGIDVYDASAATSPLLINLDTVAHDRSPFESGIGFVAGKTATGAGISGTFKDTVAGFEDATGGSGDDHIYGSKTANVLEGGDGKDFLAGYAGNDTLLGGADDDMLFGGAGKDTLTGGPGDDVFLYQSTADTKVSVAGRDTITGFENGDVIDLSAIDANTKNGAATHDEFIFIGYNPFTAGTPGQLRSALTETGHVVEGDVNGDGKADFAIEILDPTHSHTLIEADFLLV